MPAGAKKLMIIIIIIIIPKMLYTLRTSKCSDNKQREKFDELQRKCITDVINIDLNDDQWTQKTLELRFMTDGVPFDYDP